MGDPIYTAWPEFRSQSKRLPNAPSHTHTSFDWALQESQHSEKRQLEALNLVNEYNFNCYNKAVKKLCNSDVMAGFAKLTNKKSPVQPADVLYYETMAAVSSDNRSTWPTPVLLKLAVEAIKRHSSAGSSLMAQQEALRKKHRPDVAGIRINACGAVLENGFSQEYKYSPALEEALGGTPYAMAVGFYTRAGLLEIDSSVNLLYEITAGTSTAIYFHHLPPIVQLTYPLPLPPSAKSYAAWVNHGGWSDVTPELGCPTSATPGGYMSFLEDADRTWTRLVKKEWHAHFSGVRTHTEEVGEEEDAVNSLDADMAPIATAGLSAANADRVKELIEAAPDPKKMKRGAIASLLKRKEAMAIFKQARKSYADERAFFFKYIDRLYDECATDTSYSANDRSALRVKYEAVQLSPSLTRLQQFVECYEQMDRIEAPAAPGPASSLQWASVADLIQMTQESFASFADVRSKSLSKYSVDDYRKLAQVLQMETLQRLLREDVAVAVLKTAVGVSGNKAQLIKTNPLIFNQKDKGERVTALLQRLAFFQEIDKNKGSGLVRDYFDFVAKKQGMPLETAAEAAVAVGVSAAVAKQVAEKVGITKAAAKTLKKNATSASVVEVACAILVKLGQKPWPEVVKLMDSWWDPNSDGYRTGDPEIDVLIKDGSVYGEALVSYMDTHQYATPKVLNSVEPLAKASDGTYTPTDENKMVMHNLFNTLRIVKNTKENIVKLLDTLPGETAKRIIETLLDSKGQPLYGKLSARPQQNAGDRIKVEIFTAMRDKAGVASIAPAAQVQVDALQQEINVSLLASDPNDIATAVVAYGEGYAAAQAGGSADSVKNAIATVNSALAVRSESDASSDTISVTDDSDASASGAGLTDTDESDDDDGDTTAGALLDAAALATSYLTTQARRTNAHIRAKVNSIKRSVEIMTAKNTKTGSEPLFAGNPFDQNVVKLKQMEKLDATETDFDSLRSSIDPQKRGWVWSTDTVTPEDSSVERQKEAVEQFERFYRLLEHRVVRPGTSASEVRGEYSDLLKDPTKILFTRWPKSDKKTSNLSEAWISRSKAGASDAHRYGMRMMLSYEAGGTSLSHPAGAANAVLRYVPFPKTTQDTWSSMTFERAKEVLDLDLDATEDQLSQSEKDVYRKVAHTQQAYESNTTLSLPMWNKFAVGVYFSSNKPDSFNAMLEEVETQSSDWLHSESVWDASLFKYGSIVKMVQNCTDGFRSADPEKGGYANPMFTLRAGRSDWPWPGSLAEQATWDDAPQDNDDCLSTPGWCLVRRKKRAGYRLCFWEAAANALDVDSFPTLERDDATNNWQLRTRSSTLTTNFSVLSQALWQLQVDDTLYQASGEYVETMRHCLRASPRRLNITLKMGDRVAQAPQFACFEFVNNLLPTATAVVTGQDAMTEAIGALQLQRVFCEPEQTRFNAWLQSADSTSKIEEWEQTDENSADAVLGVAERGVGKVAQVWNQRGFENFCRMPYEPWNADAELTSDLVQGWVNALAQPGLTLSEDEGPTSATVSVDGQQYSLLPFYHTEQDTSQQGYAHSYLYQRHTRDYDEYEFEMLQKLNCSAAINDITEQQQVQLVREWATARELEQFRGQPWAPHNHNRSADRANKATNSDHWLAFEHKVDNSAEVAGALLEVAKRCLARKLLTKVTWFRNSGMKHVNGAVTYPLETMLHAPGQDELLYKKTARNYNAWKKKVGTEGALREFLADRPQLNIVETCNAETAMSNLIDSAHQFQNRSLSGSPPDSNWYKDKAHARGFNLEQFRRSFMPCVLPRYSNHFLPTARGAYAHVSNTTTRSLRLDVNESHEFAPNLIRVYTRGEGAPPLALEQNPDDEVRAYHVGTRHVYCAGRGTPTVITLYQRSLAGKNPNSGLLRHLVHPQDGLVGILRSMATLPQPLEKLACALNPVLSSGVEACTSSLGFQHLFRDVLAENKSMLAQVSNLLSGGLPTYLESLKKARNALFNRGRSLDKKGISALQNHLIYMFKNTGLKDDPILHALLGNARPATVRLARILLHRFHEKKHMGAQGTRKKEVWDYATLDFNAQYVAETGGYGKTAHGTETAVGRVMTSTVFVSDFEIDKRFVKSAAFRGLSTENPSTAVDTLREAFFTGEDGGTIQELNNFSVLEGDAAVDAATLGLGAQDEIPADAAATDDLAAQALELGTQKALREAEERARLAEQALEQAKENLASASDSDDGKLQRVSTDVSNLLYDVFSQYNSYADDQTAENARNLEHALTLLPKTLSLRESQCEQKVAEAKAAAAARDDSLAKAQLQAANDQVKALQQRLLEASVVGGSPAVSKVATTAAKMALATMHDTLQMIGPATTTYNGLAGVDLHVVDSRLGAVDIDGTNVSVMARENDNNVLTEFDPLFVQLAGYFAAMRYSNSEVGSALRPPSTFAQLYLEAVVDDPNSAANAAIFEQVGTALGFNTPLDICLIPRRNKSNFCARSDTPIVSGDYARPQPQCRFVGSGMEHVVTERTNTIEQLTVDVIQPLTYGSNRNTLSTPLAVVHRGVRDHPGTNKVAAADRLNGMCIGCARLAPLHFQWRS